MRGSLRIGTRGSKQAGTRADPNRIGHAFEGGTRTEGQTVETLDDRLPPERRGETDGEGAFTDEIESLLMRDDVDLAVHCMKDLSVELREGI